MPRVARFGVSGWDYADWQGPLYPRPLPAGFRALPMLAGFLDFMEVNSTFYHPIAGTASRRWLDETPPNFTFVIKAWRGWTHERRAPGGEELDRFRALLGPIAREDRLEGVLAQFPPAFRDEPATREQLLAIRDALAPAPIFVEVRHRSLYREPFLRFLADSGLDFVNVDLPELGHLPRATSINTGPRTYLRLHGRNTEGWRVRSSGRDTRYDYRYSIEELQDLVEIVRRLLERSPRVLVGANNHFQAHAPAAALAMRALWKKEPVPAPPPLLRSHPEIEPYTQPLAGTTGGNE